jgi:hypothetical protein
VTAYVSVPTSGGVDNNSLNSTNVKLFQISGVATPVEIKARVNGTGGGDAIILAPQSSLLPNTTYRFVVTEGVKSLAGYPFYRKETVFTTGNYRVGATLPVAFEKVPIPSTRGEQYTSLAVGPDRKLYALQLNGSIKRFPINGDGTLGTGQTINTLRVKYGGRLAVGLALDPASTGANPIVWSHPHFRQATGRGAVFRRQALQAHRGQPRKRATGDRPAAPLPQGPPRQQHRLPAR